MKIAIIGTGISGLGAAWLLNQRHQITVYEKNARIGGHSNTVDLEYDGQVIPVDTGFIVYNEINYPNLTALFSLLNVPTQTSNMSLSVSALNGDIEWRPDTLMGVFAQKRNIVSPRFLWMLRSILRFNHCALRDLQEGRLDGVALGAFLDREQFGSGLRDYYLLPMAGAIWSTSSEDVLDFPAETLFRFMDNHRLLSFGKPLWRTVTGGSRNYVTALTAPFSSAIRAECAVISVRRTERGIVVRDRHGQEDIYDHVVFACHSDEALQILADADAQERSILGDITYTPNRVYVHRDADLMPGKRPAWASWNTLSSPVSGRMSVTYWMNLLQSIDNATPVFVSMNPPTPPREALTFQTIDYDHPRFDLAALAAQRRLGDIQGMRNTWFCGAYAGYGFHEDGLKSGLAVAERIGGVSRPWADQSDTTNTAARPQTDNVEDAAA